MEVTLRSFRSEPGSKLRKGNVVWALRSGLSGLGRCAAFLRRAEAAENLWLLFLSLGPLLSGGRLLGDKQTHGWVEKLLTSGAEVAICFLACEYF